MTRATKNLTIKNLTDDDRAWLQAECERLGCDAENLVRMMIRQRLLPNTRPGSDVEAPRARRQLSTSASRFEQITGFTFEEVHRLAGLPDKEFAEAVRGVRGWNGAAPDRAGQTLAIAIDPRLE